MYYMYDHCCMRCHRWMQATVVNETGLRLVFQDTTYQFRTGRFWTAPGNIAANSESTFSLCNKLFGVGVNGTIEYLIAADPASPVTVSINCQNEFFGDIRCSASFLDNDRKATKTATLTVDGVATNICIVCAPGNEPKVTIFCEKDPPAASADATAT